MYNDRNVFPNASDQNYRDFIKRLASEGMQIIGQGDFATVFRHSAYPSDVVVKVSLMAEEGAYTWLEWCKENPSPYVPKVYSLYRSLFNGGAGETIFIAFMEKLEPAIDDDVWSFSLKNDLDVVLLPSMREDSEFIWDINSVTLPRVKCGQLRLVLEKIYELTRPNYSDISVKNVMLRGDQLVFNDPVPY